MDRFDIVKAVAKDLNIHVFEDDDPIGNSTPGAFFFYKGVHRFIAVRSNLSRLKKADVIWEGLTKYFPQYGWMY